MSLLSLLFSKKREPVRSCNMMELYEMTLASDRHRAETFNRMERERYERELASETRYNEEAIRLYEELLETNNGDIFKAGRELLAAGYSPRVSMLRPPAVMTVVE